MRASCASGGNLSYYSFSQVLVLLKLKLSLVLKRVTDKWIGTLVMGIVTIILGVLLIFNPFAGITITKLAGAFLVVVAVFDLIDTYIIQK